MDFMKKIKITIFLILIFILLTTNIEAYQSCDGEYTPYPVKCIGGSSVSNGNISENVQPSNILIIILIILAIIIIIIWLIIGKRKRR